MAEIAEDEGDASDDGEGGPSPSLPWDLQHVPLDFRRYSPEEMASRARDFFRLMDKRRTVRAFSSEDVPFSVVEDIIRTAGQNWSQSHNLLLSFRTVPKRISQHSFLAFLEWL